MKPAGKKGADGGQTVTNPAALLPETFHDPVGTATGDEELPGATLFQFTPRVGATLGVAGDPGVAGISIHAPRGGNGKFAQKNGFFLCKTAGGRGGITRKMPAFKVSGWAASTSTANTGFRTLMP